MDTGEKVRRNNVKSLMLIVYVAVYFASLSTQVKCVGLNVFCALEMNSFPCSQYFTSKYMFVFLKLFLHFDGDGFIKTVFFNES